MRGTPGLIQCDLGSDLWKKQRPISLVPGKCMSGSRGVQPYPQRRVTLPDVHALAKGGGAARWCTTLTAQGERTVAGRRARSGGAGAVIV